MSDSAERKAVDLVVAAMQTKELGLNPTKEQTNRIQSGEVTEPVVRAQNLASAYEVVLDKILEKTPGPASA